MGPYDAPVLLLLQGQGNSHRWWRRLRGDFTSSYLTLTFDYRGTGSTDVPETVLNNPTRWSTQVFAEDALTVLKAIGKESAHVYGTSMGGRVAQMLASSYPENVDKLVLACSSPGKKIGIERTDAVRKSLNETRANELNVTKFDLFYSSEWIKENGGYQNAPRDLLGDPSMSKISRQRHLSVSNNHDASNILGRIESPTLILHGSEDLLVPVDNVDILSSRIQNVNSVVIDRGRHGFFDEYRIHVSELVINHLSQ